MRCSRSPPFRLHYYRHQCPVTRCLRCCCHRWRHAERTRSASWSQQLPSSAFGDAGALSVLSSPCNGQAACSPVGLATPLTIPAPIPLHPCQALPRPQTQALPPIKHCLRQVRQRQHQRSSHRRTQSPPPPPRVQTHPCRDARAWPQPIFWAATFIC